MSIVNVWMNDYDGVWNGYEYHGVFSGSADAEQGQRV